MATEKLVEAVYWLRAAERAMEKPCLAHDSWSTKRQGPET